MSRSRIDPVTADQVREIIQRARAAGTDPVRLLDVNGLLRYGARTAQDRLEILDWVVQALNTVPPERLPFDRMPSNPIDLRNVMIKFLAELREGLARNDTTKQ